MVRLFLFVPRCWACERVRLSVRLDERWGTGGHANGARRGRTSPVGHDRVGVRRHGYDRTRFRSGRWGQFTRVHAVINGTDLIKLWSKAGQELAEVEGAEPVSEERRQQSPTGCEPVGRVGRSQWSSCAAFVSGYHGLVSRERQPGSKGQNAGSCAK